jgi:hypothetical protein
VHEFPAASIESLPHPKSATASGGGMERIGGRTGTVEHRNTRRAARDT